MPGILEDFFNKIARFIEEYFVPKKTEHETRQDELKTEEFDVRDEFEQRSYDREQTRTGVVDKGRQKPTKVW